MEGVSDGILRPQATEHQENVAEAASGDTQNERRTLGERQRASERSGHIEARASIPSRSAFVDVPRAPLAISASHPSRFAGPSQRSRCQCFSYDKCPHWPRIDAFWHRVGGPSVADLGLSEQQRRSASEDFTFGYQGLREKILRLVGDLLPEYGSDPAQLERAIRRRRRGAEPSDDVSWAELPEAASSAADLCLDDITIRSPGLAGVDGKMFSEPPALVRTGIQMEPKPRRPRLTGTDDQETPPDDNAIRCLPEIAPSGPSEKGRPVARRRYSKGQASLAATFLRNPHGLPPCSMPSRTSPSLPDRLRRFGNAAAHLVQSLLGGGALPWQAQLCARAIEDVDDRRMISMFERADEDLRLHMCRQLTRLRRFLHVENERQAAAIHGVRDSWAGGQEVTDAVKASEDKVEGLRAMLGDFESREVMRVARQEARWRQESDALEVEYVLEELRALQETVQCGVDMGKRQRMLREKSDFLKHLCVQNKAHLERWQRREAAFVWLSTLTRLQAMNRQNRAALHGFQAECKVLRRTLHQKLAENEASSQVAYDRICDRMHSQERLFEEEYFRSFAFVDTALREGLLDATLRACSSTATLPRALEHLEQESNALQRYELRSRSATSWFRKARKRQSSCVGLYHPTLRDTKAKLDRWLMRIREEAGGELANKLRQAKVQLQEGILTMRSRQRSHFDTETRRVRAMTRRETRRISMLMRWYADFRQASFSLDCALVEHFRSELRSVEENVAQMPALSQSYAQGVEAAVGKILDEVDSKIEQGVSDMLLRGKTVLEEGRREAERLQFSIDDAKLFAKSEALQSVHIAEMERELAFERLQKLVVDASEGITVEVSSVLRNGLALLSDHASSTYQDMLEGAKQDLVVSRALHASMKRKRDEYWQKMDEEFRVEVHHMLDTFTKDEWEDMHAFLSQEGDAASAKETSRPREPLVPSSRRSDKPAESTFQHVVAAVLESLPQDIQACTASEILEVMRAQFDEDQQQKHWFGACCRMLLCHRSSPSPLLDYDVPLEYRNAEIEQACNAIATAEAIQILRCVRLTFEHLEHGRTLREGTTISQDMLPRLLRGSSVLVHLTPADATVLSLVYSREADEDGRICWDDGAFLQTTRTLYYGLLLASHQIVQGKRFSFWANAFEESMEAVEDGSLHILHTLRSALSKLAFLPKPWIVRCLGYALQPNVPELDSWIPPEEKVGASTKPVAMAKGKGDAEVSEEGAGITASVTEEARQELQSREIIFSSSVSPGDASKRFAAALRMILSSKHLCAEAKERQTWTHLPVPRQCRSSVFVSPELAATSKTVNIWRAESPDAGDNTSPRSGMRGGNEHPGGEVDGVAASGAQQMSPDVNVWVNGEDNSIQTASTTHPSPSDDMTKYMMRPALMVRPAFTTPITADFHEAWGPTLSRLHVRSPDADSAIDSCEVLLVWDSGHSDRGAPVQLETTVPVGFVAQAWFARNARQWGIGFVAACLALALCDAKVPNDADSLDFDLPKPFGASSFGSGSCSVQEAEFRLEEAERVLDIHTKVAERILELKLRSDLSQDSDEHGHPGDARCSWSAHMIRRLGRVGSLRRRRRTSQMNEWEAHFAGVLLDVVGMRAHALHMQRQTLLDALSRLSGAVRQRRLELDSKVQQVLCDWRRARAREEQSFRDLRVYLDQIEESKEDGRCEAPEEGQRRETEPSPIFESSSAGSLLREEESIEDADAEAEDHLNGGNRPALKQARQAVRHEREAIDEIEIPECADSCRGDASDAEHDSSQEDCEILGPADAPSNGPIVGGSSGDETCEAAGEVAQGSVASALDVASASAVEVEVEEDSDVQRLEQETLSEAIEDASDARAGSSSKQEDALEVSFEARQGVEAAPACGRGELEVENEASKM